MVVLLDFEKAESLAFAKDESLVDRMDVLWGKWKVVL